MDDFLSAIFGARESKASARVKVGSQTRVVALIQMPTDVTPEAFANAAEKGVNLAVRVKTDEDRVLTMSAKNVFGAAARSATCHVLGFTPTPVEPPAPSAERPRSWRKDESPAPATNATVPTIH
ncbi:hypothetical protein VT84_33640 [Gemmata sp. SH-PL17]|uniref:hypothetical protein n=1 Tax=Gemmata sp. SH-PL17 TaxID=1630693 RepID=UPI00078D00CF|nr:hypothetical protein [Gemmata sp. SH-PL17]AMV29386.1 hypothetical protein VT84_33640 [Gemmata sp. SH-PL17]